MGSIDMSVFKDRERTLRIRPSREGGGGSSSDGGIDGIIEEEKLGLDAVYVQGIRWTGPVRRPAVQEFAGSLQGAKARKGVLITASRFSRGATDFAERLDRPHDSLD